MKVRIWLSWVVKMTGGHSILKWGRQDNFIYSLPTVLCLVIANRVARPNDGKYHHRARIVDHLARERQVWTFLVVSTWR